MYCGFHSRLFFTGSDILEVVIEFVPVVSYGIVPQRINAFVERQSRCRSSGYGPGIAHAGGEDDGGSRHYQEFQDRFHLHTGFMTAQR